MHHLIQADLATNLAKTMTVEFTINYEKSPRSLGLGDCL
jgi:hypothetical protein